MSVDKKYISNFKRLDDHTLHFDISHLDLSFVNALRRTLLSKIDTIVFDTTQEDTVTFFENTTYLKL